MLKWRYEETRRQINATELGVARALAMSFGGKRMPDLPEYEEIVKPTRYVRSEWMARFEEANPGRVIQTG